MIDTVYTINIFSKKDLDIIISNLQANNWKKLYIYIYNIDIRVIF